MATRADRRPQHHVVVGLEGAGSSTFADLVLRPATGLMRFSLGQGGFDDQILSSPSRLAWHSFIVDIAMSTPVAALQFLTGIWCSGYGDLTVHAILAPPPLAHQRAASVDDPKGESAGTSPADEAAAFWRLLRIAVGVATTTHLYDNSKLRRPFHRIGGFDNGVQQGRVYWPRWVSDERRSLGTWFPPGHERARGRDPFEVIREVMTLEADLVDRQEMRETAAVMGESRSPR